MYYQSRNIADLFVEWIIQFNEKRTNLDFSFILQREVGLRVIHCLCSYSIFFLKCALNHHSVVIPVLD